MRPDDEKVAFNKLCPDPSFERGIELGGSLLVQAALVAGADGRTIPEDSLGGRQFCDDAIAQEIAVEQWAKSNGCWYDDYRAHFKDSGYVFYGYGGEAQVYTESSQYVHKACRIEKYDSLMTFFQRIVIENALCPPAHLAIEGFGRNAIGDFVVLMRQTFFRQGKELTRDEIDRYFANLGFEKVLEQYGHCKYISDKVIVEDMHPGNIWETPEGSVVIIDGIFEFNNLTAAPDRA